MISVCHACGADLTEKGECFAACCQGSYCDVCILYHLAWGHAADSEVVSDEGNRAPLQESLFN